MPFVVRKGDKTRGHSGHGPLTLTQCAGDVKGNGKPVGLKGDVATGSNHDGTIVDCSSDVTVNGKGVARVGDKVRCGDVFANGSSDIKVN